MSDERKEKHPVVEVAHEVNAPEDTGGVTTLSTGYLAKIVPVSASLIDQVTSKVKDPEVPMWMNEEKGREEPNPADPAYLTALDEAAKDRGLAAMDALIMFGVELEEEQPENLEGPDGKQWLKKLKFLGIDVDTDDPFELEFFFKKYVAVSAEDVNLVTSRSGMSAADVEAAERSFRRQAS
jgi:hypothetical protein